MVTNNTKTKRNNKRKLIDAKCSTFTELHHHVIQSYIDQVLASIRIQYNKLDSLNEYLHTIKQSIQQFSSNTVNISANKQICNQAYQCTNFVQLQLRPPSQYDIYGEYAQRTQIHGHTQLYVDMYIQIDDSVQEIDAVKYIDARAMYMHYLLQQLTAVVSPNVITVQFLYQCKHLPVLCIDCSNNSNFNKHERQFTVRIIPMISRSMYDTVSINNQLIQYIVAVDAHHSTIHDMIDTVLDVHPNSVDAIKLLSLWYKQRCIMSKSTLVTVDTSFTLQHLTLYMCHLCTIGIVNQYMTPYQIFRTVLQQFALTDFGSGIQFSKHDVQVTSHSAVVFMIGNQFNCTQLVSMHQLQYLQQQASHTIQMLQHTVDHDTLQEVFMSSLQYYVMFDHYIAIKLPANVKMNTATQLSEESSIDLVHTIKQQLHHLLSQAFNTRVQSLYISHTDTHIHIGITINPAEYKRVLDVGPDANNVSQATAYRTLWGDWSTLRRFQDGRITEAVVFNCDVEMILFRITQHIVELHMKRFGLRRDDIVYVGDQCKHVLSSNAVTVHKQTHQLVLSDKYTDTGTHISHLHTSFKALSNALRALNSVPLTIVHITSTHPAFRNTATFVPQSVMVDEVNTGIANCLIDVIPVQMQFETSNQWPADVAATDRLKTAFYIQIARCMADTHHIQCIVAINYVDIIVQGIVYRVTIFHDKELQLRQQITNNELLDRTAAELAMKQHQQYYYYVPTHHAAIRTFGAEHDAYTDVCRLMKRWLAAHMVMDYLSEEVIELIVAYTYMQRHQPYTSIHSIMQGFHRVLRMLASFDYYDTPMIVDINNDMTEQQYAIIQDNFVKRRSNQSADSATLWIGSTYDVDCNYWTMPSKHTMLQLRTLAASAAIYIQQLLQSTQNTTNKHWNTLFVHDKSNYDIVIHCNTAALSTLYLSKSLHRHHTLHKQSTQLHTSTSYYKQPLDLNHTVDKPNTNIDLNARQHVLLGVDVMHQYVQQLRQLYGSIAEFHYDIYGGTLILIKLRSHCKSTHPINIHHCNNTAPQYSIDVCNGITINREQLCTDMMVMGEELVDMVQIQ